MVPMPGCPLQVRATKSRLSERHVTTKKMMFSLFLMAKIALVACVFTWFQCVLVFGFDPKEIAEQKEIWKDGINETNEDLDIVVRRGRGEYCSI